MTLLSLPETCTLPFGLSATRASSQPYSAETFPPSHLPPGVLQYARLTPLHAIHCKQRQQGLESAKCGPSSPPVDAALTLAADPEADRRFA